MNKPNNGGNRIALRILAAAAAFFLALPTLPTLTVYGDNSLRSDGVHGSDSSSAQSGTTTEDDTPPLGEADTPAGTEGTDGEEGKGAPDAMEPEPLVPAITAANPYTPPRGRSALPTVPDAVTVTPSKFVPRIGDEIVFSIGNFGFENTATGIGSDYRIEVKDQEGAGNIAQRFKSITVPQVTIERYSGGSWINNGIAISARAMTNVAFAALREDAYYAPGEVQDFTVTRADAQAMLTQLDTTWNRLTIFNIYFNMLTESGTVDYGKAHRLSSDGTVDFTYDIVDAPSHNPRATMFGVAEWYTEGPETRKKRNYPRYELYFESCDISLELPEPKAAYKPGERVTLNVRIENTSEYLETHRLLAGLDFGKKEIVVSPTFTEGVPDVIFTIPPELGKDSLINIGIKPGQVVEFTTEITLPDNPATYLSDSGELLLTPFLFTSDFYMPPSGWSTHRHYEEREYNAPLALALSRYTVTFDTDSSTPLEPQLVIDGQTATQPASPTKDGYTFAGWYHEDTLFDFSIPVTSDISLIARWLADTTDNGESALPTEPVNVTVTPSKYVPRIGDEIVFSFDNFGFENTDGSITDYRIQVSSPEPEARQARRFRKAVLPDVQVYEYDGIGWRNSGIKILSNISTTALTLAGPDAAYPPDSAQSFVMAREAISLILEQNGIGWGALNGYSTHFNLQGSGSSFYPSFSRLTHSGTADFIYDIIDAPNEDPYTVFIGETEWFTEDSYPQTFVESHAYTLHYETSDISLELTEPRPVYLPGDTVALKVSITNKSEHIPNSSLVPGLDFGLMDSAAAPGNAPDRYFDIPGEIGANGALTTVINPGETIQFVAEITLPDSFEGYLNGAGELVLTPFLYTESNYSNKYGHYFQHHPEEREYNAPLTLPVFSAQQYTVTFVTEGSAAPAPQVVAEGLTATRPANPVWGSYIFGGWYLGDTLFDFNTPITADITLSARWLSGGNPDTPGGEGGGESGSTEKGSTGDSGGDHWSTLTDDPTPGAGTSIVTIPDVPNPQTGAGVTLRQSAVAWPFCARAPRRRPR